jgi:hypothetical protein
LLECSYDERNDSFHRHQGGLLYKAPLTASVFKDFSSCYHHLSGHPSFQSYSSQPFVYVDSAGMKLVTQVLEQNTAPDGVFALSMAHDGWMEMLALFEAS